MSVSDDPRSSQVNATSSSDIKKILRSTQADANAVSSKASGRSHTYFPMGYDPRGFINLNMLALASEERRKCELCNNIGVLQCELCRVTYYCSIHHFTMDKDFHANMCQKLKFLRSPIDFSPQRETRERWIKQRQIHMNEMYLFSWKNSQSYLNQGLYDDAIPAATVASKYAQILYGQSEEMIPPMMVAAECYLNQGNFRLAEGFIARASSIEMHKPDLRPTTKAQIRHNEGLLAMAKNDLQDALIDFADEVYLTSEEYGPIHRKTAIGFCHLGRLFHQTHDYLNSNSLFRQVVEIWTDFLLPIHEEITAESIVPKISRMKFKQKVWIEETDRFDAEQILMHCYINQMECHSFPEDNKFRVPAMDLAHTCYALSLLFLILKKPHDAETFANEALGYVGEQDAAFTKKLQRLVKLAGRMLAHPPAEIQDPS